MIAIIGVMVGLLLPAVQAAREAARRMSCSNNLKQLGLAVHNYHDTNRAFPYNAAPEVDLGNNQRNRGASWFVRILPFIEQGAAYEQVVFAGDWTMQHGPSPNAALVNQLRVATFNCPSSPLPMTRGQTAPGGMSVTLQMTNYVGIAGSFYQGGTTTVESTSPSFNTWYGKAVLNGVITNIASSSPPIGMHSITDGTSNTIMVGEQSDYQYNPLNGQKVDRRSCGHAGSTWSSGQGTAHWTQNVTTIRYPIAGGFNATGNAQPYHISIPLFAAHPGGVQCALADGSVRFVTETIDFSIMTALADRGDGSVIGEY